MGVLNPVVSKFGLTTGQVQQIYQCSPDKSYAVVDVNFYKDDTTQDSMVEIALSTESNPANLTSVDYFMDDIALIGNVNSAELSKIVVGSGERLYVKAISGPAINVRVSGVEEVNSKISKAGRLAAASIAGVNQTLIYQNLTPGVAYVSASITIFNTSTTNTSTTEVWITSSGSPSDADKLLKIDIAAQDTTILENIMMSPNEQIYYRASQPNSEIFINGMVVLS